MISPTEALQQLDLGGECEAGVVRQAVSGPDEHAEQVGARAHSETRRSPDDVISPDGSCHSDDDAFPRLPLAVDAVDAAVLGHGLVHPFGGPRQRQLAQRPQVAGPEVVAEGGVDPLRRVDLARGHPLAYALLGQVDELDLAGAAHHLVRDRLPLHDVGYLEHDIVEGFEMLDVEGAQDVDTGFEQRINVLPTFPVW